MTESRPRYCPRCGAEAVGGMPFCRNCGLDLAAGDVARPAATTDVPATMRATTPPPDAQRTSATTDQRLTTPTTNLPVGRARVTERSSRFPPIVLAGLLVMLGLLGYGFLTRPVAPSAGGTPGVAPSGAVATASALVSAPIVGLAILSPTDGQAVATKDINVIGTAPPGVSITRDVSLGLDEHTTSDGTGHWAMRVGLNKGENKLVFRIGDDQSTRHEIRVTYTPPSGG